MSGEKKGHDGFPRRRLLQGAGAAALTFHAMSGALGQTAGSGTKVAAGSGPKPAPAPNGKYNILFIFTDQERYFARPPAGAWPGHERLEREGVTFENHQICAAVCTPSRSVVYTGRHIQHTGMFDNTNFPWQDDMSTEIPTIGDMLRECGYYTAYKGKFHLNETFDTGVGSGIPEKLFNAEMEEYGFSDFHGIGDVIGHTLGGYHFDEIVAATTGHWLRSKGRPLNDDGKPWFMAVNFVNPHDVMMYNTDLPGQPVQGDGPQGALITREPALALYHRKWGLPLPPSRHEAFDAPGRPSAHTEFRDCRAFMVGKVPDEDDRWQRLQDYYVNCIADCDRSIDRLLTELDELGIMDNTIVILSSDHGELCGAHGLSGKGATAFREQNHVPFIVKHPAVKGGQRCKAVTSHLDIVPTMLSLAGADAATQKRLTKDLPGKDISQLLADPENASLDAVGPGALYCFNMWSYLDANFMAEAVKTIMVGADPEALAKSGIKPDLMKHGAIRTVYDGRYKFSRYFANLQHNRPTTMEEVLKLNTLELFDLENDPYEMNNLALDTRKNGELVMAMNEKLNGIIDSEVGEDVGQMLPAAEGVNWAVTKIDP